MGKYMICATIDIIRSNAVQRYVFVCRDIYEHHEVVTILITIISSNLYNIKNWLKWALLNFKTLSTQRKTWVFAKSLLYILTLRLHGEEIVVDN